MGNMDKAIQSFNDSEENENLMMIEPRY
jgi:hypothetical protein